MWTTKDEANSLGRADRVLERTQVPDDGEADIIQLDCVHEKRFNMSGLSAIVAAESKLIASNQVQSYCFL